MFRGSLLRLPATILLVGVVVSPTLAAAGAAGLKARGCHLIPPTTALGGAGLGPFINPSGLRGGRWAPSAELGPFINPTGVSSQLWSRATPVGVPGGNGTLCSPPRSPVGVLSEARCDPAPGHPISWDRGCSASD